MTNFFFLGFVLAFMSFTNLNAQVDGRIILTSMGTDVQYRVGRTAEHLCSFEYETQTMADGKILLETLKGEESEPVSVWVNFSHGNNSCLFGKDHKKKLCYYSSGLSLYPKNRNIYKGNQSLGELKWAVETGAIQFTEKALIVIHACVAGSVNEKEGLIFAQEVADITGATVIAGQHQTEPVLEDEVAMIYSNVHQFVKFRPNEMPVLIGKELNLTQLLKDYVYSKGTYTLADYPYEKWEPNMGERSKAAHCLPPIYVNRLPQNDLAVKILVNLAKRNNKQV